MVVRHVCSARPFQLLKDPKRCAQIDAKTTQYILKSITLIMRIRHAVHMDMRKLVGSNFARIRRERGLTQEQVEAKSGFSQQYLSGLERGQRNPTVVTVYELAQALGVSHVDLLAPIREIGASSRKARK